MTGGDVLYSGQRFRKSLKAFLFGRFVQGIVNLALTFWVVRLLEPRHYGAYMSLWGMIEMLVPLSSLGLLHAMRRYLPDLATRGSADGVRRFVRWLTLARFGMLFLVATLLYFTWHAVTAWFGFDANQAGQSQIAIALVVTVLGFRFTSEMLECLLEQRWSQTGQALLPIGRLLGLAWLVFQGRLSLGNILLVDMAVSGFCLLLLEAILMRKLAELKANGTHSVAASEFVAFAWHMTGMTILQAFANPGAMRLLVARLLGLEAAGLYAFLQQLLMIVGRYMPAQLLANIIRPMLISAQASGNAALAESGIALMWKSNLLIVIACISAIAVSGEMLIALASGGRFTDAVMVALLLFVELGATSQAQLIVLAMQIHDRARELRDHSAIILLAPLLAWLGGAMGLPGMVAGMAVGQWLRNAFGVWWLKRHDIAIPFDFNGVLRVMTAGLVAMAAGWPLSVFANPWLGLAAMAVVLCVGMLLGKPLSAEDQSLLERVLKGHARLTRRFVHP